VVPGGFECQNLQNIVFLSGDLLGIIQFQEGFFSS